MSQATPITIAYGNGIGPEIMEAVLKILNAGGANIKPEVIEIGETIYNKGIPTGIEEKSWDSLYKTKVFLKAPITTPQGGGFRSLNVTIRRKLGLYANIRPCISYHPFVPTKHKNMDVIIIRENEEGLYTGIEYQQTQEMFQCLKLISKSGSQRIHRFAFEYAFKHKRKKVTCFTKDNIMKKTDGLFRKIFEETGARYPELKKEHWIVDIGSAKLADSPENFDVLVLPNLYGDILSDVAAQISGSVGMAGSANIGEKYAMFEAIHGSAPRRAGQNIANPSGLLQSAVLMLLHIGQKDVAENIQNAWLKTLEDGIHTYDIYQENLSQKKVRTKEFTSALIDRLKEKPKKLKAVTYQQQTPLSRPALKKDKTEKKTLVGVDIFLEATPISPKALAENVQKITSSLKLEDISSRGVNVWPEESSKVLLSDHWRCRFTKGEGLSPIKHSDIVQILSDFQENNIDFIKTENLYLFNGQPGFSLTQQNNSKKI